MADDSDDGGPMVSQTSFISSAAPQMRPMSIQLPYEVVKTWTSIYPAYLNSSLTVAEGRRVPRSKCEGCIDPSVHDVLEACAQLRLTAVPVSKRYSKSDIRSHGRVQVRLRDSQKEGAVTAMATAAAAGVSLAVLPPLRTDIPNKQVLLAEIAKLIPTLEGRKKRMEQVVEMTKRIEEARVKGPRSGKMSKKEQKQALKDHQKQQQQSAAGGGGGSAGAVGAGGGR